MDLHYLWRTNLAIQIQTTKKTCEPQYCVTSKTMVTEGLDIVFMFDNVSSNWLDLHPFFAKQLSKIIQNASIN